MSDPEIIKSSTPHRVSIPEGSSNAVGKKAEVGEASIRKSLHDASEETNDITKEDHALKGKNAMAAQGGGDFNDVEIGRAVVYMANKGGAKFDEPKAPAAAAASK
jgi:hypothetical protein